MTTTHDASAESFIRLNNNGSRLLADIGGTNARFAWQSAAGAPLEHVSTLRCAEYVSLDAAIREYLLRTAMPTPSFAAIAIANPVQGDQVQMTNHSWSFSTAEMRRSFAFDEFVVLNDFKAIALSLPALGPNDLRQVGGGVTDPGGPRGVIGPGTGLGVSGLLPDCSGGWVAVDGEGGHATLAACNAREWDVIARISRRYGHVSAERAVSGQGLADIHRALREIDGAGDIAGLDVAAPEITIAAIEGGDASAREALQLFCAFLGTIAGNLALTLGASGGIYIGGGIVPRLGAFFDASPFRERFEAKGRFSGYAARIPTFLIVRETSPALLGAERALDAAITSAARAGTSRRSSGS